MDTTSTLPIVTNEEYVASRKHIFPSTESLRWFERQHRAELLNLGAILLIAGRRFINPTVFDAAVMAIGKRMAERQAEKP